MQNVKKFIGNVPIYYINLDSSSDRKEKLLKFFCEEGVCQYKRVNAIDGNSVDIENLKNKYHIYENLSKPEIGCALSHYKAIEMFYESGENYGLIIEDDCSFDYVKFQKQSLQDLINECTDWEVLKLSDISMEYKKKPELAQELALKKFVKKGGSGAQAYIIKKEAAAKILEHIKKEKTLLQVSENNIFTFLKTTSVFPPPFTFPFFKENPSTIRSDTKGAHASQTITRNIWDNYYKNNV